MRTRHWLAGLMSGCIALAGVGTASAQQPMGPSNGNPNQSGLSMLPAPYGTALAPGQPDYSGMNMPGYPPGAQPWPSISPFEGPPVQSTLYENGFWYNNILQGDRQYYGSIEAIWGKTSKPTTVLIGAPGVNPLTTDSIAGRVTLTNATTSALISGSTQFNQTPGGNGPVRSITSTTGGTGGGTSSTTALASANIFPSYDTGALSDTLNGQGIRGTWGWFNPDDTGLVVSGFMQSKGTSAFGLNDPALVIDPNNRNFNDILHLHAWFGLPLAGADTDGTSLDANSKDGAVIPFDMGVNIQFLSRIAGGSADWYFNSVYDQGAFKVRPLGGVKYVRLQEAFVFDGFDSGEGYTVSNSSSSTTGGTSTAATTSGFLTPLTFQPAFDVPNVTHSHLSSTVLSDMLGPEIGFRVDMGRKNFTMNLQTRAGALADTAQRQISGFGIGNMFNIIGANTVTALPNNPAQTSFNNNTTSTSLVPMFEQQINFKTPFFAMIPYLNRMEIFERAQLTGGYTFLFLGDVYRPNNTIIWNQTVLQPTFNSSGVQTGTHVTQAPSLDNVKSNFMNSFFNIGIEWTY